MDIEMDKLIQLGFVLGGIGLGMYNAIKTYLENRSKKREQQKLSKLNNSFVIASSVNERLTDHMYDIEAMRVIVIYFHNGGVWATGESMNKFSARYEVVKPGYSRMLESLQSVPASLYSAAFAKLSTGEGVTLPDNSLNVTSTEIRLMGARTILGFPIMSKTGYMIGALYCHFDRAGDCLEDECVTKSKEVAAYLSNVGDMAIKK